MKHWYPFFSYIGHYLALSIVPSWREQLFKSCELLVLLPSGLAYIYNYAVICLQYLEGGLDQ